MTSFAPGTRPDYMQQFMAANPMQQRMSPLLAAFMGGGGNPYMQNALQMTAGRTGVDPSMNPYAQQGGGFGGYRNPNPDPSFRMQWQGGVHPEDPTGYNAPAEPFQPGAPGMADQMSRFARLPRGGAPRVASGSGDGSAVASAPSQMSSHTAAQVTRATDHARRASVAGPLRGVEPGDIGAQFQPSTKGSPGWGISPRRFY